jgi:ribose transport system substrate-binding protein
VKRIWTLLLAAVLVVGVLAGCSSESTLEKEEKASADDKVKIGLSVSTLNNPFFVSLKEGAEEAAKESGAELIVADAQDDNAKQLINPTDSKAVSTAVESANKAKIPVITVDRESEGGEVLAHIASDNVAGGKMAGEFILEHLKNKGNIVELEGIPGTSAARDRGKGFHQAVDNQKGIKVVASQPANFNRDKGLTVMENILQSNPEIDAVFAHNDEMALGALQAIQAAKKEIVVVGFDATDDAVKSVKKGDLGATIAQKPEEIGKTGVEVAVQAVKGEKVDKFHPVELELIKK